MTVVECDRCSRSFRTNHALQQHTAAVHFSEEAIDFKDMPFPGAEGYWVLREDFPKNKSFGRFRCNCGRHWLSAHAYKEKYAQNCQSCYKRVQAYLMFVSTTKFDPSEKPESSPHDAVNCEACRSGHYCTKVYDVPPKQPRSASQTAGTTAPIRTRRSSQPSASIATPSTRPQNSQPVTYLPVTPNVSYANISVRNIQASLPQTISSTTTFRESQPNNTAAQSHARSSIGTSAIQTRQEQQSVANPGCVASSTTSKSFCIIS
jgi:hypothetical protein